MNTSDPVPSKICLFSATDGLTEIYTDLVKNVTRRGIIIFDDHERGGGARLVWPLNQRGMRMVGYHEEHFDS
jgi:hypothetical protein